MTTTTGASTERLVEQYRHLAEQKAHIDQTMEQIKAELRARLDVGSHETPAGKVSISVNRRFDETTARAVLAPEVIAAATAPRLDSALVKKLVPPLTYDACCAVVGQPRVSVS